MFLTTHQMSGRVVSAVLLAFLIFAVYSWYTTRSQDEGFDINSQQYEPAPPEHVPVQMPVQVVAPAGPSSPTQLSRKPPTVVQDERPFDPQEQDYESADHPERLRHPERMFGPGIMNDSVEPVPGVASYASQVTEDAHQTFGPEFAQNGGNFMGDVAANDTSLKTGYSSV
jgi:hypothetical protein